MGRLIYAIFCGVGSNQLLDITCQANSDLSYVLPKSVTNSSPSSGAQRKLY